MCGTWREYIEKRHLWILNNVCLSSPDGIYGADRQVPAHRGAHPRSVDLSPNAVGAPCRLLYSQLEVEPTAVAPVIVAGYLFRGYFTPQTFLECCR